MKENNFDRTNAVIAFLVFLVAFIVYAMTVQRSFSFWDCGEFIACAHILGIPHPPGTPLFVLLGRIFSIIPFVADISYRVNYISVISSALTAMFSYLLTVRLIGYFFGEKREEKLNRLIAYIGGVVGGLFAAFSETNWGNSVEAEVYGMSLMLMVMIVWLTVRYFENRGTVQAARTMILVFYLAMVGIGIHLTVFLVVPIVAIFYMLNDDARAREYLLVCGFIILELVLIFVLANGAGVKVFYALTAIFGIILLVLIYNKINWGMVIAIGAVSSIMISFRAFMVVLPLGFVALAILGYLSKLNHWQVKWKNAMLILLVALIGFSVHLFIPIRSAQGPRIDENNPDRDLMTFLDFLDRKQYGQESMVDRMFERRGEWIHQFGRHPHMGFWSFFEEQYSKPGVIFTVLLILGIIGMYVAIIKRLEIGLPFFTVFLVCSVGLILYMNFADGTKYGPAMPNAYLEVRNRDYFFTPAFVFFGIAIGLGVGAVLYMLTEWFEKKAPTVKKTAIYASTILVLLPAIPMLQNYHACDRSKNFLPLAYATDILDTCDEGSILFTSGDNDTFPVWCLQEVYNYRKDVTVVNLSLLNTDWYIYQMKNQYGVPISLTKEQILWYPFDFGPATLGRAREPFYDRPRKRMAFLGAFNPDGILNRNMMTDEIILENKWERPIFFTSTPYAQSPLKLIDRVSTYGILYRLEKNADDVGIWGDVGYDKFMNDYSFDGMNTPAVYRDDNSTSIFILLGNRGIQIADDLINSGEEEKGVALLNKIIEEYPEYWQTYVVLSEYYEKKGDSTKTLPLFEQVSDTLQAFLASNPTNQNYMQNLGMVKVELGRRTNDQAMMEEGVRLLIKGFYIDPTNLYAFQKITPILVQSDQMDILRKAALKVASYKRNLNSSYLQRVLSILGIQTGPAMPDMDM